MAYLRHLGVNKQMQYGVCVQITLFCSGQSPCNTQGDTAAESSVLEENSLEDTFPSLSAAKAHKVSLWQPPVTALVPNHCTRVLQDMLREHTPMAWPHPKGKLSPCHREPLYILPSAKICILVQCQELQNLRYI